MLSEAPNCLNVSKDYWGILEIHYDNFLFYFHAILKQIYSTYVCHDYVIQLLQYNFRSMWCCSLDLKLFWCIFDIGPMIMYNAFFSVFSILVCSPKVFESLYSVHFDVHWKNVTQVDRHCRRHVTSPRLVEKSESMITTLLLRFSSSQSLLPLPLLLRKGWRLLFFFFLVFAP